MSECEEFPEQDRPLFSPLPVLRARVRVGVPSTEPNSTASSLAIALEPADATGFVPQQDRRPLLAEPPPVFLELVADAHLPTVNGSEKALNDFYIGMLQFERDEKSAGLVYKAENFRLIFDLSETPATRDDFRTLGIVVKSLPTVAEKLRESQIEFTEQRGLAPAEHCLVLQDPAGNWLRITRCQPF
jgi:hypothetical protein